MHSFSKTVHLSELLMKIWMKIDLYCQRRRLCLMTCFWQYKVCVDVRGGSLERGIKRQRGNRKWISTLSTLRLQHVEKWGQHYCYLIPCRLSTDPEMYDLEWLWMARMVIICYSIVICFWVFISSYLHLQYLLYSMFTHGTWPAYKCGKWNLGSWSAEYLESTRRYIVETLKPK